MSRTILVADDSRTVRTAVRWCHHGSADRIIEASSGEETLALVAEAQPDVLLLDYAFPDRSGLDVLRAIRRDPELSGTRVVLLHGTFHPFDVEEARAAGADALLAKPFGSEDLLDTLRRTIDAEPGEDLLPAQEEAVDPLDEALGDLDPSVSVPVSAEEDEEAVEDIEIELLMIDDEEDEEDDLPGASAATDEDDLPEDGDEDHAELAEVELEADDYGDAIEAAEDHGAEDETAIEDDEDDLLALPVDDEDTEEALALPIEDEEDVAAGARESARFDTTEAPTVADRDIPAPPSGPSILRRAGASLPEPPRPTTRSMRAIPAPPAPPQDAEPAPVVAATAEATEAAEPAAVVAAPATPAADAAPAAVALPLSRDEIEAMIRAQLQPLVREVLSELMQDQIAPKVQQYAINKINGFVENEIPKLAQDTIRKFVESGEL